MLDSLFIYQVNAMFNYHFDEFIINKDSLFNKGKPVSIPPKELAVLYLLVTHTGEIIFKDDIINHVWCGGCVSDESLARCIYVIRKTLGETTDNIFINTIYGKGYRFLQTVTKVSRHQSAVADSAEPFDETTVAVFPFNMQNKDKSFIIFDYLMSQHEYFNSECSITLAPSALTINSLDINKTFADLRQTGVRYFITGNEIIASDVSIIRIELTDSTTMAVISRRTVILSIDNTINLINVSRGLIHLLKNLNITSSLKRDLSRAALASPLTNINMFTLSFSDLLDRFDSCENLSLQEFYFLAERYTLMGFVSNPGSEYVKRKITDHAQRLLENDTTNARALAIKTVHRNGLSNCQRESLFEVAMMLGSCAADIYFYYACLLIHTQKYTQAMQSIDMAIMLDKKNTVYQIMKMIVLYKQCKFDQAIKIESDAMGDDTICRVIVKCLRIKIFSETGDLLAASETLKLLERHRTSAFVDAYYIAASHQITAELTLPADYPEQSCLLKNSYLTGHVKYLYSVS